MREIVKVKQQRVPGRRIGDVIDFYTQCSKWPSTRSENIVYQSQTPSEGTQYKDHRHGENMDETGLSIYETPPEQER